jgi:ABC-2 type transport system permease protein
LGNRSRGYAWVSLLGITACTLLGIAATGLVKNGRSAPAIISPIAIVLQFISGVFFGYASLPTWMQDVGVAGLLIATRTFRWRSREDG